MENLAADSALDGMFGQRHALTTLPEGQRSSTHSTAGWVRPKAGLKRCGQSGNLSGLIPTDDQDFLNNQFNWTCNERDAGLWPIFSSRLVFMNLVMEKRNWTMFIACTSIHCCQQSYNESYIFTFRCGLSRQPHFRPQSQWTVSPHC